MKTEKIIPKKCIVSVLLAAFALISALWLADLASSPELHAQSLADLDEKKVTVMELTAASAAASVAISAVPGDATTPLANQVSQLSSYLLLAAGAILLEKILLTLTGYLAFAILIPAACVLGIASLALPRAGLRRLAWKLAVFGLVIWLAIPVCLRISNLVEDTFQVQQTVEEATQAAEDAEEAAGDEGESSGGLLSQIGDAITGTVSSAVGWAEDTLSRFVDAVAALVIVNCVIPILTLWLFLWLAKAILGLQLNLPVPKRLHGPASGGEMQDSRTDEMERPAGKL